MPLIKHQRVAVTALFAMAVELKLEGAGGKAGRLDLRAGRADEGLEEDQGAGAVGAVSPLNASVTVAPGYGRIHHHAVPWFLHVGAQGLFATCAGLMLVWLVVAWPMRAPRPRNSAEEVLADEAQAT
jgi:hypothetical protein